MADPETSPELKVWLVRLRFGDDASLTDELFERGLKCVDAESQVRIRKFYHLQDRWRCLVGRLLPRLMLREQGASFQDIVFDRTEAGKPIVKSPASHVNIAFNVTHDNEYVGMAFCVPSSASEGAGLENLGMDLMKVEIPRGETPRTFANVLSDQLTPRERTFLSSQLSNTAQATETIYKYWTAKEAYTKALGMGLGFDFSRVEVDFPSTTNEATLSVDGTKLSDWEFKGLLYNAGEGGKGGKYIGVVARQLKSTEYRSGEGGVVKWICNPDEVDWVKVLLVEDLVRRSEGSE